MPFMEYIYSPAMFSKMDTYTHTEKSIWYYEMELVLIVEELRLEWAAGSCVWIITVIKRHHQPNIGHMITHVRVIEVLDIWVGVRTTWREKTEYIHTEVCNKTRKLYECTISAQSLSQQRLHANAAA